MGGLVGGGGVYKFIKTMIFIIGFITSLDQGWVGGRVGRGGGV